MKSSREKAKPETISIPVSQVTSDPVPGYTTTDFWRDLEEQGTGRQSSGQAEEFARFRRLAKGLVGVPKDEIDKRPS